MKTRILRSIRTPIANLAVGTRTLSPETSHHLCRVLRLDVGDSFVAFDPASRTEADATIDVAEGTGARVTIGDPRPAPVIARRSVVLVYGLAKGDKVDAVVQDATELGATRVIVARTTRAVVKASGGRADAKLERWRRIAEQGARQCGRADPPSVDGIVDWAEALERAAEETEARFCLWEHATEPLGPRLTRALANGESMSFAIGPEGGLTTDEVELARVSGYAPVSLGRFVLRTETVAAAVLGAVRVLQDS